MSVYYLIVKSRSGLLKVILLLSSEVVSGLGEPEVRRSHIVGTKLILNLILICCNVQVWGKSCKFNASWIDNVEIEIL